MAMTGPFQRLLREYLLLLLIFKSCFTYGFTIYNQKAPQQSIVSHRMSPHTVSNKLPLQALLLLSQLIDNDEIKLLNNSEEDDSKHRFSKSKWKKKRFLLLKDVQEAIQRGDATAPRKAEDMIRRMQRLYERTNESEYQPTLQAYNLWIHAVAKSKSPHAGQQAEVILRSMKVLGLRPNRISYTSVMDAYVHHQSHGAEHAERLLFELLHESERFPHDHDLRVTSVTADTVLNAWAQQRGSWEAAERAQLILERLESLGPESSVQPTQHSYATVIHAWASCHGGRAAAEQAAGVLNKMLRRAATVTGAVKPDTVVFNAVMHAWANSGDAQAGSNALALLHQMQQLSSSSQEEAYHIRPDTVSYNTVLSAWSHSGHVNAAKQAERILQEMRTDHREAPETSPAPNTVSYNNVLNAWSKSSLEGAAERAEKVLLYMIQSADMNPDVYSFTSVLDALAKSNVPDKARRAQSLLQQLLDLYRSSPKQKSLKPTHVPFNTVLNACAFSGKGTTQTQQREALQVAVQTFRQMKDERVQPDTVTYGNMIKCVANLMPLGRLRSDMAWQLFEKCSQDGLVGDLVWNELRRSVPLKVLQDRLKLTLPVASLQVRDLPRHWRTSVRGDRKAANEKRTKVDDSNRSSEGLQGPVNRLRNISEPSYQSGRDM